MIVITDIVGDEDDYFFDTEHLKQMLQLSIYNALINHSASTLEDVFKTVEDHLEQLALEGIIK
jgi:hypothetical protein